MSTPDQVTITIDDVLVPGDPLWVFDDHSRMKINVRPFLNTLNKLESRPGLAHSQGGADAIMRVIRTMCLTAHDPSVITPTELVNVYDDLFKLWDLFELTGAIEINKK